MMVSWDDEDRGRIWAAKEAASARFPGLLRATKFGHFPVELVADDDSRQKLLSVVAFDVFGVGVVAVAVVVVTLVGIGVVVVVASFDVTFLRRNSCTLLLRI